MSEKVVLTTFHPVVNGHKSKNPKVNWFCTLASSAKVDAFSISDQC